MTADKQLPLFPAASLRLPLTREQVRWSRRVVRTVRTVGPVRVDDLAGLLGCDPGDARFALGVAKQWRRVEVRDGFVVLAEAREEGTA